MGTSGLFVLLEMGQGFETSDLDSGLTVGFNTSLGKVGVLSGLIQIFESPRHFLVRNAVRF